MPTSHAVLLSLYYGALVLLVVYGLHRLVLTIRYLIRGEEEARTPTGALPKVTVQLPMYNERYVAVRLMEAAAELDYPRELLQIQVLDDSTDITRDLVDAAASRLRAGGTRVDVVRRDDRDGYKAGALEAGLKEAEGDLIAVFDADFVPNHDFLQSLVGHFEDPRVGMVQARWGHLNREYNLLTRAQAVLLDGHFVVEQTARSRTGCFFNFNGTAGIWRRQAIEDAGGWQHDTLTEDLDLSYRAQLAGWRFVFRTDVEAPAEIPAEIGGFRSQQHRWAKGSIECLRKLLPRLIREAPTRRSRHEGLVHLTANLSYVWMLLIGITMPWMVDIRLQTPVPAAGWLDLALLCAGFAGVCVFYFVSERRLGRSIVGTLAMIPVVLAIDIGLSLHKSRAAIEALIGYRTGFVRTPKFALARRGRTWRGRAYLTKSITSGLPELVLATWCLVALVEFAQHPSPPLTSLPFLALFGVGYLIVGGYSLIQAIPMPAPRAALESETESAAAS